MILRGIPADCVQATGETYDATTLLMQKLLRRVNEDRTEMNLVRELQNVEPLPTLEHMWTMMFFARDSRMMYHLQKKRWVVVLFPEHLQQPTYFLLDRGFMPLEECT